MSRISSIGPRLLAFVLAISASAVSATNVTGAGSSFVFPLMSKWSADYHQATGNKINYQSIGSSGGIAQIKAGTVDFGATDKPLSADELRASGLIQFPVVIGGVVPVVNVSGVAAGSLKLSGALLADIFSGKVSQWNDAAITALNPGITLPAARITVVHRSDGSGTTFNFVNYLSKASPMWSEKVGEGTSVQWPVGLGGKGNEGVAAYVKQVRNAIGYVELSYALQNKMAYTQVQNSAGQFVQPNAASFAAAATGADWAGAEDFNLIITDAPGASSWPISATVFVLMQAKAKDAERAKAARDFFAWGYANGRSQAGALDYVPLPDALVTLITNYWSAHGL